MNQPLDRANMAQATDPLPSWNDGLARRSIVGFVTTVTSPSDIHSAGICDSMSLSCAHRGLFAAHSLLAEELSSIHGAKCSVRTGPSVAVVSTSTRTTLNIR